MHTKDLTTGSPMKLILSFMLPLVFGLLFQQVYSMVDTIVVGKFLGVDALAGVGSTGSITFLVLGLCNGVCAGFAIPVAQKFGQRDFDGLRRFVGNMIWLGCVIAAAVTLVTTLLCRQILLWMDTPADTFSYAYDYIFVIFLGIPATMLYNLLSGILRSLGDSKTPLVFLIMCSLLNVALDPLLIFGFHLEVAGAAIATAASNAASVAFFAAQYARLGERTSVSLHPRDISFRFVRPIFSVGLASALATALGNASNMGMVHLASGYGDIPVAAYGIVKRIDQFPLNVSMGLCQGFMPLVGYTFAAKADAQRVRVLLDGRPGALGLLCRLLCGLCAADPAPVHPGGGDERPGGALPAHCLPGGAADVGQLPHQLYAAGHGQGRARHVPE